MTGDRRLTPFNGRVAHAALRGQVAAEVFAEPQARAVAVPLADLCHTPDGSRDRQLLLGARFDVLEWRNGWAYGLAEDGYCGWIAAMALGPWSAPTHWVAAPASHLYPAPDVKSRAGAALSVGASLTIIDQSGNWLHEAGGAWLPARHLREIEDHPTDPVAVAQSLLGTPYLWGGNSRAGIDCSGLVQVSCRVCGLPCPADSDMQAAGLGRPLLPGDALTRGDLVFWKGHVGWMVDDRTLLHANAHHMAVACEPLEQACARIAASGGGGVTCTRRIAALSAPA